MAVLPLAAVGNPPALNRLANIGWFDNLIDYFYRACPLVRTNTVYINVSAGSGSATGGTGTAGTYASPYLVRDLTDLNTLLANAAKVPQDDVRIRLADRGTAAAGNYFRVNATTPVGLSLTTLTNFTLDSYSTSAGSGAASVRPFVLLGSVSVGRTGWTDQGSSVVSKTFTSFAPHQVFTGDGTAEHQWKKNLNELGFRKLATVTDNAITNAMAALAAVSGPAFVYNSTLASGTLFVKLPSTITGAATMPIDIEAVKATTGSGIAGIIVGSNGSSVGNSRIDNHSIHGFGDPSGSNQRWNLDIDIGTSSLLHVTRGSYVQCLGYHNCGTRGGASGANAPFGVCMDDITVGWCNVDSNGEAKQVVGYMANGRGQFVFRNIKGVAGSYPTTLIATPVTCELVYCHATPATPAYHDLIVYHTCGIVPNFTNTASGTYRFSSFADGTTSSPSAPYLDPTAFRIFAYNCTSYGDSFLVGSTPCLFINCTFPVKYNAASWQRVMGSADVSPRFLAYNTVWAFDLTSSTFTSSSFPTVMFNGLVGTAAYVNLVYSSITWRAAPAASTFSQFLDIYGENTIDDDWGNSLWYNSIIGADNACSPTITNNGNILGCAFTPTCFRANASANLPGYDSTTGPVELRDFVFNPTECPTECLGAGRPIPAAYACDYDRYLNPRTGTHLLDIGPVAGLGTQPTVAALSTLSRSRRHYP